MKCTKLEIQSFNLVAFVSALLLFIIAVLMAPCAMALTVTVNGADNTASPVVTTPLTGYRWLIEEDATYHVPLNSDGTVQRDAGGTPVVDPTWQVGPDGVTATADDRDTLSVSFHQSYMPVVAKGTDGVDTFPLSCTIAAEGDPCLDPDKYYFISVLPAGGYSIGGAPIKNGDALVFVNKNPIPTAQITVLVHEDVAPINNVWDLGENGLGGFAIILEDAGGKYGASAGIQSQDAFGNALCTTYEFTDTNGNGTHDPGEPFVADADGAPVVTVAGAGCLTGANGTVTVRNLAPGKYGIMVVPPNAVEDPVDSGNFVSSHWVQTSTIEGTKLIDAWVKADEPAFFGEFGPPGPHVTVGFVPAGPNDPLIDATVLTGGATISGQVVNLHLSAPPDTAFYNGGPFPHTTPWVGLNMGAAGMGRGIYAQRANDDGSFAIPNVPPGSYQLVVWDDNLDLLFSKNTVVVNADDASPTEANGTCNALTSCTLGNVPVFQWFARMEHYVYNDENESGTWDEGELPMIEQNVNLRFRDGTIYQAFPTDGTGVAPFDQVFPFFSWLVSEVDFGRFKATGANVIVDDGGAIPFGDPLAFDDNLNPQQQADGAFTRTDPGVVLTQAFQGFLGQTSVVEWGKKAYAPGENGGISGMVMYAVTRAEDDPELAAAEPWEPGIPRVTVNLYDATGNTLLAATETDSWDDSLPTDCQPGANRTNFIFRGVQTDCFDGMRVWNQVRPGVFDGGYAFTDICEAGLATDGSCAAGAVVMPAGQYMVEVVPPYGYEVIKSQDRNVDFGDTFFPSPELLPPVCSGADYEVPDELSLFPGELAPLRTSLTGQTMKMCDRKLVNLADGANAAADFFLFTEVPIAGHFIGFILDDTANEFDPTSPQFGEKYAPPFLPVSIRDWTGREISRTVSDEYGVYNALIPSTFTENLGQPSGISPNMLTTCMNAKTLPDGSDDPLHNPQYSQFCYTFQYMPGSTTYLDTPVVPVAAFAGPDQNPLDCEYVTETPRIFSVDVPANGEGGGPYVPVDNQGNIQGGGIVITSMGERKVPNPAYGGVGSSEPKNIIRDYGFGTQGTGTVTIGGVPVAITSWSNDTIEGNVLAGTSTGQLTVTRDNGESTITGVTVQVGLRQGSNVVTVPGDHITIQAAINAAGTNDLILVAPGTYDELVVMWKPVQLQGWGEGSVTIDAVKAPFNKLADWRILVEDLESRNVITRAPGQELGFGGIEPETFFSEEGAGVFVVAKSQGNTSFGNNKNHGARIDGMTISGADTGGGVVLNAFADFMEISNLRVTNNSAFFAGGVRVGHPFLTDQQGNNLVYSDTDNDNVVIHHNTITQNGGLSGAGGGLALHTGSDGYQVTDNFVCGNFTNASGAGIAHYGESDGGLIKNNTVLFNENFNQGNAVNGGGILVAGLPAFGCPFLPDAVPPAQDPACLADPEQTLSPGSGSVVIDSNLIQGNSAGSGDGAGIRLSRINGQDVNVSNKGVVSVDHVINVINNMIVDNVAALSGGGISIQDALDVKIFHNTIANNDVTSTSGEAFAPGLPEPGSGLPVVSVAQPGAGIIARGNSSELNGILPVAGISNANMMDNIIWHNRQFFWMSDTNVIPSLNGLCPDINGDAGLTCAGGNAPVYDDLAVGTQLCVDCILTGAADPVFVSEYVNGSRNTTTLILEGTTSMQAPPAFDEGGNFIRLRYGPLTQVDSTTGALFGDYHIQATGSSAMDAGSDAGITSDFDGEPRPNPVGGAFDIGADEVQQ